MSENLSSGLHREVQEQPKNLSLQVANEFFHALSPDDREIFALEYENPQLFAEMLQQLPEHTQQDFLKILKSNLEITTEIADTPNLNTFKLINIINRYKEETKQVILEEDLKKEEMSEEKEEMREEKEEMSEEKEEMSEEKEEMSEEKEEMSEEKEEMSEEKEQDIDKERAMIQLSQEIFLSLQQDKFPEMKTWQDQAESEILRNHPELAGDPENLKNYAQAYVLLQHSEHILQTQPDLTHKVQQLQVMASGMSIFKNIESQKQAQKMDISFQNKDVLKRDLQQAKAALLPDGQELKIDGNVLTSGDQKLTFRDNGPKKEITRHGYAIDTTVQFTPDYKFKYESQNIRQTYQKTVEDYKSAETNLQDLQSKIQEIDQKIANADDDLLKEAYTAEKDQLTQTEGVVLQQQYDKQKSLLLEVYDQANTLDAHEKQRIPEYQKLQEQKDLQARETLDFLNNMGLTYIPQETFELLLVRINKSPQMYGFPRELSLESGFGGTLADKKAIKEGFLNLFSKLYEKIGIDMKGITVDKFINGTAGDQFKNQTFDTRLENPGGFKTKGTFNSATFIDFMLAPKESSEAK